MSLWSLILRSLWFHRRVHLGTLLGAAAAVALLTGALVTGDSMRHSLDRLVSDRLGRTTCALEGGDRIFRAALADDLTRELHVDAAPLLSLTGLAFTEEGGRRANRVRVQGVDRRFWALGPAPDPLAGAAEDEVAVNRPLAGALGLRPGDGLLLRVRKKDWMSAELPFSRDMGEAPATLRLRVRCVVSDEALGRFDLRAGQVPPCTVFLSRSVLARHLELEERANTLLVAGDSTPQALQQALGRVWQPADAGLSLRSRSGGGAELVSDQVFLEEPVSEAARAIDPGATPVLTYFANRMEANGRSTPYSFVSAAGAPIVPAGMADDEILLGGWLAEDLQARPGQSLRLRYFVLNAGRGLEERESTFRVRGVLPPGSPCPDASLTPAIPGLSDAGNCRDWHPGIPIDLSRIRPCDEAYWNQFRGTPKAFVTLAAARKLWSTPFGSSTSIRFSSGDPSTLARKLARGLRPESVGLAFRPVREEGARASADAVDFGGLFLGFNFILLTAALLLTALLFALGAESRSREPGILLALGLPPGLVRRLLLLEGTGVALAGTLLGIPAGAAYSGTVLGMLGSVWRGATGIGGLHLQLRPATLALGALLGALVSLGAAAAALWRISRRPVRDLLAGRLPPADPAADSRKSGRGRMTALFCLGAAAAVLCLGVSSQGLEAAGVFWAAGSLTLAGGLFLCRWFLARPRSLGSLRPASLGAANATRRPGRSLAVVAMLACGIWLVLAVGLNRRGLPGDPDRRDSGTGGFAFWGETTLPIPADLSGEASRRALGLTPADRDVRILPLRVREGDEASCLNLHRVRQPRLLGVDAAALEERRAFAFARTLDGRPFSWRQLQNPLPDGTLPAVADANVIQWSLGLAVGDILVVRDERGRPLRLRLVAGLDDSLFQGGVLIGSGPFVRHFPSVEGARALLVDAPPSRRAQVAEALNLTLQDRGLELVSTSARLAAFQVVENTYLSIFLALGGLGLVLGTAGLGTLLLRHALERRGELALLRAVGFSLKDVRRTMLAENALLLGWGMVCGAVPAALTALPVLARPAAHAATPGAGLWEPLLTAAFLLLLLAGNALLWSVLATRWATRGNLFAALRDE